MTLEQHKKNFNDGVNLFQVSLVCNVYTLLPNDHKEQFDRLYPDFKTITDGEVLSHAFASAMIALEQVRREHKNPNPSEMLDKFMDWHSNFKSSEGRTEQCRYKVAGSSIVYSHTLNNAEFDFSVETSHVESMDVLSLARTLGYVEV